MGGVENYFLRNKMGIRYHLFNFILIDTAYSVPSYRFYLSLRY